MRSNKHIWCFSLVVAVVFVFTMVQPSVAQVPGMPKLYGEFKMPEKGAYATYKVTDNKSKAERIIKLSIVGKEKSEKGKDLYWYEIEETNSKTGAVNIMKMLISGNPQEIGTIQRMIVKSGKETASELPSAMIQMINQVSTDTTKAEKPKMKNLGLEKMKIGKETLKCDHFQYLSKGKATTDVWINAKVPLFGLVKSTTPDVTMELLKYGTNAVSAIKEKPEVLQMPEGK